MPFILASDVYNSKTGPVTGCFCYRIAISMIIKQLFLLSSINCGRGTRGGELEPLYISIACEPHATTYKSFWKAESSLDDYK